MFRTLRRRSALMLSTPCIRSPAACEVLRRARLLVGALVACLVPAWAQAQISDIEPPSLPDAVVDQVYSVRLTPVNPFQGLPVLWSVTPGCLGGSGLVFTPQNGIATSARISGRALQRGTFLCTVVAQDAGDNVVARQYTLSIVRGCNPPKITSLPPQAAVDPGVPFSYAVTATGRLPHAFSALGLPPGLAIDSSTGVISGTTESSGTYAVTVIVGGCGRSATQSFTLVVGSAAVALALTSTPNPAVFGQDIAVAAHAAGGSSVPTGSVLLCIVAPGQFCAAPVGAPPIGTPATAIPPLASSALDANGDAAFTLRGLAIQNYVLQAYYGGDATHAAASSVAVDQFVIKGAVLPPGSALRGAPAPAQGGSPEPIPASSPAMLALGSLAILAAALRRARRH
jgi:hypothetical protein